MTPTKHGLQQQYTTPIHSSWTVQCQCSAGRRLPLPQCSGLAATSSIPCQSINQSKGLTKTSVQQLPSVTHSAAPVGSSGWHPDSLLRSWGTSPEPELPRRITNRMADLSIAFTRDLLRWRLPVGPVPLAVVVVGCTPAPPRPGGEDVAPNIPTPAVADADAKAGTGSALDRVLPLPLPPPCLGATPSPSRSPPRA